METACCELEEKNDPETQGFISTMGKKSRTSTAFFLQDISQLPLVHCLLSDRTNGKLLDSAFCLIPDYAVTDRSNFFHINGILQISVLEALRAMNTPQTQTNTSLVVFTRSADGARTPVSSKRTASEHPGPGCR